MFDSLKKRWDNIFQKINGGTTKILVNNVTVRPPRRSSQDIANWRTAMQQAEGHSQQRKTLFDLYEDILLDGYLTGVTDRRVQQITNADLVFTLPDGKPIDEINSLVGTSYFEDLLTEIMNAKFWGHSLIELLWTPHNSTSKYSPKTVLIPRKNVKPRWGIVTKEEFGLEGTEYRKPPFSHQIIEVGGNEDLGLFLKVAQYVIYKRGDFGDWAEFASIFGIPFRHATYNNEATRKALEDGLEKAGPAGYLVSQEGTQIEFKQGNPSGNGEGVFRFLRQACNEEIAYTILGNTMTSMESRNSGYAQSKTHADAESELIKADRRFVLRVLNEQLIPYLEKMGYPVKDGKWKFQDEESLSLTERINIDIQLSELIDIGEDYWYEKYGIPKPKKQQKEKDPPKDPGKKKTDKEVKLSAFYGYHENDCTCGNCITLSTDTEFRFTPISSNTEKAILAAIRKGNFEINDALHRQYYQRIRKAAQLGFARSLSKAKDWNDFVLQQGILQNISEFAIAKQYSLIEELKTAYQVNPKNFDRVAKATLKRYHRQYFETELGTISAAANSASQWEDFQNNIGLYPNLKFSTVGDSRVRDTHRLLDGAVYPVNDPFWDSHTPPLDWRCRCILLQTDEKINPAPSQQSRAGLGANPFKTKKLIQKDHPYFEIPESTYVDLMSKADILRAAIERPSISGAAKKQVKKAKLNGESIQLSTSDLAAILKSSSEDEAIRNALLTALIFALEQATAAGTEAATGYQIFNVAVLDTTFQFYFESGENLALKKLTAL